MNNMKILQIDRIDNCSEDKNKQVIGYFAISCTEEEFNQLFKGFINRKEVKIL